jgi:hypothetical protein
VNVRIGFLSLALLLLASGCGGSFKKREIFAAYGENGEANYYRVTIAGYGTNSEVDYRAGWYDKRAIDSLFGDLAARQSLQAELATEHKKVLQETFTKYLEALRDDADPEKIERTRKNFQEAMDAVTGVAPADAERTAPLDYADKKFVMILSTNPDKIVAAIKGRIQQQKLVDALAIQLQSAEASKAADERSRSAILAGQVASLVGAIRDAKTHLDGEVTDQTVRVEVERLIGQLEVQP